MVLELKSVLLVDGVGENCSEVLKSHGIEVVRRDKISSDDLLKEIPKHDALVVRSASQVTSAVLKAGSRLKVVARAGSGVDNIDVLSAQKLGIGVINAPGANAISACELTCSLILALARHVVPAAKSLKEGAWLRSQYTGTEVNGKVLAVLGLGRVGREVATRMHAFGMRVIGYDPLVSSDECKEFHTTKLELNDIWSRADYITLHTPLLESTKYLINKSVLKYCKPACKIINVGRGGLIQDEDLLEALQQNKLGGVALDVFEEEPPTSAVIKEIIAHPAVIATPHLGASTKEAQIRVGIEIAEQLVNLTKPNTYPTPLAEVTKLLRK